MRWERVSDDVVPVNITCIEDTPNTIFQITAYNRQVEKIFDVKITQPECLMTCGGQIVDVVDDHSWPELELGVG
ncbi:hypothetical protein C0Q70_10525 [Pomacea canaliculata]|uniref:Uncharacterized protein n=1 Tax=Pomacea canaliculata TaxID=400727 RepID=A0A2T7P3G0_POMCA|nr:hypothetical protein C0Q70_10525 [Pomacea canaliculata]